MGLFSRFTKKEELQFKDSDVVSPVKGGMISAKEIDDPVFSEEIMGQTIAVEPENGEIVCPVNGTVSVVFPTGHSFGITTSEGNGFLVHIGIDTVSLNGKGFKTFIKQGEKVKAGQKAVQMDLDVIKKAGLKPTVILIVSEKNDDNFTIDYIDCKQVQKGQIINRN